MFHSARADVAFIADETLVLSSGYQLLHASMVDDTRLLPILPVLRQRSDALFCVCVACQACLSHGANESFFDYYDEALALFRADLEHPVKQYDDATLIAALLLCTIGVSIAFSHFPAFGADEIRSYKVLHGLFISEVWRSSLALAPNNPLLQAQVHTSYKRSK